MSKLAQVTGYMCHKWVQKISKWFRFENVRVEWCKWVLLTVTRGFFVRSRFLSFSYWCQQVERNLLSHKKTLLSHRIFRPLSLIIERIVYTCFSVLTFSLHVTNDLLCIKTHRNANEAHVRMCWAEVPCYNSLTFAVSYLSSQNGTSRAEEIFFYPPLFFPRTDTCKGHLVRNVTRPGFEKQPAFRAPGEW